MSVPNRFFQHFSGSYISIPKDYVHISIILHNKHEYAALTFEIVILMLFSLLNQTVKVLAVAWEKSLYTTCTNIRADHKTLF